MASRWIGLIGFGGLVMTSAGLAQQPSPPAHEIRLLKCLAVGPISRSGRSLLHTDPVEAQIVAGKWSPPKEGDPAAPSSKQQWKEVVADKDGWMQGPAFSGGYAYASVSSEKEQVMILEAVGDSMVYVNGVPRTGDPYEYGWVRLPVQLKAGANNLLFLCGRGRLRARLYVPSAPASLDASDATLPDLRIGEKTQAWGAVVLTNATTSPLKDAVLEVSLAKGMITRTPVPALLPLSTRKVAFRLEGAPPEVTGDREVKIRVLQRAGGSMKLLNEIKLKLRVREPQQTYKRAFISEIDGSVQYYAVNPAHPVARLPEGANRVAGPPVKPVVPKSPLSLVLSLHGASVEALGQADAYSAKTWAHIVAPTNRRPYGFDWEDWGRLDAMEVLRLARAELHTDPNRTYLTGHSMGGHGTWQVGATFPDQFAAIAPSAGWISFFSYGGGRRVTNPTPMEEMLQRATSPSDTLSLLHNYLSEGVYILHGGADDNVPVTEARNMAAQLAAFHHDYAYHEQPGAGHWWSVGDEPGAQCVDWPPIFDMFARHALPDNSEIRDVNFTTANPEVSAWCRWAGIEAQAHPLKPSTVELRFDPNQRRFSGKTVNVARLALDLNHLPSGKPVNVELDGQKLADIPWPMGQARIWLVRTGEQWSVFRDVGNSVKSPVRSGPFKNAFNHHFFFVYGTKGTPEENAWALAKARYDAETFWYRGNGSVDIIPDTQFDPQKNPEYSVILYGNVDTNIALLAQSEEAPIRVDREGIQVGNNRFTGKDLACVFLLPRSGGSDGACIGVVSGTGIAGMRLTERLPYFVSGVGFPDCLVIGPETLASGAAGVKAAGYFGPDWSVEKGEFVFNR
jgi:dienelactone hydrolase